MLWLRISIFASLGLTRCSRIDRPESILRRRNFLAHKFIKSFTGQVEMFSSGMASPIWTLFFRRVNRDANALDVFAKGTELDQVKGFHIVAIGQRQVVQFGSDRLGANGIQIARDNPKPTPTVTIKLCRYLAAGPRLC